MVQQSEQYDLLLCGAPIVEGGGYCAEIYHGYHLSHKTSYNQLLSDLIGTDSWHNCSAWWSEPSYVTHCLVTVYLVGTAEMFLSIKSRAHSIYKV